MTTAINRRTVLRSLAAALAVPTFTRAREIRVTGADDPDLRPFDDLMTSFLRQHQIPGGALAVARQGRLVYARGFGLADVEADQPVEPRSTFRIASVTKPITAVAVLRLVERGVLKLDDRVFDRLQLGDKVTDGATLDPRWKQVTLRQLLRHTGGWDRDKTFDPMFRQVDFARRFDAEPPAGPDQIIRAMLGEPLQFNPGARHAYSNFGYCLLGRVIEQATGQGYEASVRREVLDPLGIRSMRIGRTRLADRQPGEVRYYSPPTADRPSIYPEDHGRRVPPQYGDYSLETLDAHGGWIASAADLVRFASACSPDRSSPLLKSGSIRSMYERPPGAAGHEPNGRPKDAFYALGWQVRPVGRRGANTWHTGSLPGTSTLLVRRFDGLDSAALFNTRDCPDGVNPAGEIDGPLHGAADAVKRWPDRDLFPELLSPPPA